jgi:hypothetical protein
LSLFYDDTKKPTSLTQYRPTVLNTLPKSEVHTETHPYGSNIPQVSPSDMVPVSGSGLPVGTIDIGPYRGFDRFSILKKIGRIIQICFFRNLETTGEGKGHVQDTDVLCVK